MRIILLTGLFILSLSMLSYSQSNFWVSKNAGISTVSITSIGINSEGYLFAGTYTQGVLRSTDNGDSWTHVNNGLPLERIYSVTVSRGERNFDNIYVATYNFGVFRSSDDGASWEFIGLKDPNTFIETVSADELGNLYASVHNIPNNFSTIFITHDEGFHWDPVEIGNPIKYSAAPSIVVPLSGKFYNEVLVGTNWGVYHSKDHGSNWERLVPVGFSFAVNAVAANYRGDIFAAATDSAVYKSTDGGQSWKRIGVTNAKVIALVCNASGILYAGTYGAGTFRSLDDGETWESINSGLQHNQILCLTLANSGDYDGYLYAGGTGIGVFRSKDITTPFMMNKFSIDFGDVKVGQVGLDSIRIINRDTTTLNIYYAVPSDEHFGVEPSLNTLAVGETTYFKISFTPSTYDTFHTKVSFLHSANSNPDEVIITGIGRASDTRLYETGIGYGRVFLGTHSDQTIQIRNIGNDTLKINNLATTNSVFTASIDNTSILPGERANITIRFTPQVHGSYSGILIIESNSLSSPDTLGLNGFGRGYPLPLMSHQHVDFENVKVGLHKDTVLTLSNLGEDTLWITNFTSNSSQFHVFISGDPLPPGESRTFSVQFAPIQKGELFGTLYLRSNALSSPDSITVHGLGEPNSNVEVIGGVPQDFILYQNYPNPFNPSTTIKFGLPRESSVNLMLYNSLGDELGMLVNEILPAGYFEVNWKNTGYASGMYFYRIIIKSVVPDENEDPNFTSTTVFDQTKRIMLMK